MLQIDQFFEFESFDSAQEVRYAAFGMLKKMQISVWRRRKDEKHDNQQGWRYEDGSASELLEALCAEFSQFYEWHEPVEFIYKIAYQDVELWLVKVIPEYSLCDNYCSYAVVGRFQYATDATLCKMALLI
jgi:hypothetical protein